MLGQDGADKIVSVFLDMKVQLRTEAIKMH